MRRWFLYCNTSDVESSIDATFSTDIKFNKALCRLIFLLFTLLYCESQC